MSPGLKMMTNVESPASHFGFLSIVDLGSEVLIGGYLIVNAWGRPVEFHCTEPVKPNRAQQILYGATLRPFVCSEQIGPALVDNASIRPCVLCTDLAEMLFVRHSVDVPVVCLTDRKLEIAETTECTIAGHSAYVSDQHESDRSLVECEIDRISGAWEITEPFERIKAAVTEIQKAA